MPLAVLAYGFRPFFFLAGCWAAVAMALWLLALHGALALPTGLAPAAWHAHELVYGYGVAALSGFLLTAIPNWTGRFPLQGGPLAGLALLWLAGRIAVMLSGWTGAALAALVDVSYLVVLLGFVGREIVAGRNWRNLPMLAALALLASGNALSHAGEGLATYGLRLGIAVLAALIGLVGGRIVPSFTRNWLARRGAERLPAPFGPLDRVMLALSVAALAPWIVAPEWPGTGALAGLAGIATLLRLWRWRTQDTAPEPLLWVLHLGYLWLGLGFGLIAAVPAVGLSPVVAVHALTVGAIGTMTLAVMTRASLGHSGRPLRADGWTAAVYAMITAAALARLAADLAPTAYLALIDGSAALWTAAFALFAVRYAPILLLSRRAEGAA